MNRLTKSIIVIATVLLYPSKKWALSLCPNTDGLLSQSRLLQSAAKRVVWLSQQLS